MILTTCFFLLKILLTYRQCLSNMAHSKCYINVVIDKDNDKGIFWEETLSQLGRYRKERHNNKNWLQISKLEISNNRESWNTFCFYLKRESSGFFIIYISLMFLILITDTCNLKCGPKCGPWNLFRFDLLKSSLLRKLIFYCHISKIILWTSIFTAK